MLNHWTKKIIVEEGHTVAQLVHILYVISFLIVQFCWNNWSLITVVCNILLVHHHIFVYYRSCHTQLSHTYRNGTLLSVLDL